MLRYRAIVGTLCALIVAALLIVVVELNEESQYKSLVEFSCDKQRQAIEQSMAGSLTGLAVFPALYRVYPDESINTPEFITNHTAFVEESNLLEGYLLDANFILHVRHEDRAAFEAEFVNIDARNLSSAAYSPIYSEDFDDYMIWLYSTRQSSQDLLLGWDLYQEDIRKEWIHKAFELYGSAPYVAPAINLVSLFALDDRPSYVVQSYEPVFKSTPVGTTIEELVDESAGMYLGLMNISKIIDNTATFSTEILLGVFDTTGDATSHLEIPEDGKVQIYNSFEGMYAGFWSIEDATMSLDMDKQIVYDLGVSGYTWELVCTPTSAKRDETKILLVFKIIIPLLAFICVFSCGLYLDRMAMTLESVEQQVVERTSLLTAAKIKAEQSDVSKAEFLSFLCHELRNPLHAIVATCGFLKESIASESDNEYLEHIHTSCELMVCVVNDVLDFSKIESGKLEIAQQEFDLKKMVTNVVASNVEGIESKGLKFTLTIDPSIPSVLLGDPMRLSQIFYNLLSNATKFTDEGSIEVEIRVLKDYEMEELCLDTKDVEDPLPIMIACKDTGIGMTTEFMNVMFDPYHQEKLSKTRFHGGTGLGLSICKQLVARMNGNIICASEVGKGTEFRVLLCLRVPPASSPNESRITIPSSRSALRQDEPDSVKVIKINRNLAGLGIPMLESRITALNVLYADDNNINLKIVTKFLSKTNVVLTTCGNGMEAVNLVAQNHYDVVILDLNMPVMGGVEACEKIRDIGKEPLPIIVSLSANVLAETNGAFDWNLTKPLKKGDCLFFFAFVDEFNKYGIALEALKIHA